MGLIDMNELAQDSVFDLLMARVEISKKFGFERVDRSLDRSTFYRRVKHYYETKQRKIDAGFCNGWNHYDIDPKDE